MTGEESFERRYPALARWVQHAGWIEIGRVYWARSLIRVLDEGGMVWEGGVRAATLSVALAEADAAVVKWLGEQD
jgi:hypothetical protein